MLEGAIQLICQPRGQVNSSGLSEFYIFRVEATSAVAKNRQSLALSRGLQKLKSI
jgi:hypothetical protein